MYKNTELSYKMTVCLNKLNKAVRSMSQIIETINNEYKNEDSKVELSILKKGDIFKTDKRKYIVLEQYLGMTKIISLDFVLENENFDDNGNDYKNSHMRKKCDTEILEDFESEFGAENIVEHEVDLTTVDNQKCFGTTTCKVRPLTFDEVRQYNEVLVRPELPDWYWTCTAWSTDDRGWPKSIAVVCPSGFIFRSLCHCDGGVRPVCILKSNVLVSKIKGEK